MDKKRILLVDDEAALTRSLGMYLEATGKFEIRAVNRGGEAIRVAREFKPHLVRLDLMMPEVDGTEVAERMKADPELTAVPIVFLTALVKKSEVGADGSDIGGHPFLAKPVDPEKVVECIERNLRR